MTKQYTHPFKNRIILEFKEFPKRPTTSFSFENLRKRLRCLRTSSSYLRKSSGYFRVSNVDFVILQTTSSDKNDMERIIDIFGHREWQRQLFLSACFMSYMIDSYGYFHLICSPMLLHRMNLVCFGLFRKHLGNSEEFFGQMVHRSPQQKLSVHLCFNRQRFFN